MNDNSDHLRTHEIQMFHLGLGKKKSYISYPIISRSLNHHRETDQGSDITHSEPATMCCIFISYHSSSRCLSMSYYTQWSWMRLHSTIEWGFMATVGDMTTWYATVQRRSAFQPTAVLRPSLFLLTLISRQAPHQGLIHLCM